MIYSLLSTSFAVDMNEANDKFTKAISSPGVDSNTVLQAQKDFAASQAQWANESNKQTQGKLADAVLSQTNGTWDGTKFHNTTNNNTADSNSGNGKSNSASAATLYVSLVSLAFLQ